MEKMSKLPEKSASRNVDSLSVQARRAFTIGIVSIVIAVLVTVYMIYLTLTNAYSPLYYVIGNLIGFIILTVVAILLSRSGKTILSGWLIIFGIFAVIGIISLLVRNVGGTVSVFGLFAILFVAIQVLPQRQVRWATFLGVFALVMTRLAESSPGFVTVSNSTLETVIQSVATILLVILGILILRQFTSLSLTNKLLITFLVTAIVVTYAANYFNQTRTTQTLTDSAGQNLSSLAKNQAQAIGDVMASEINSLISLSLGSSMQSWIKAANAEYPTGSG